MADPKPAEPLYVWWAQDGMKSTLIHSASYSICKSVSPFEIPTVGKLQRFQQVIQVLYPHLPIGKNDRPFKNIEQDRANLKIRSLGS